MPTLSSLISLMGKIEWIMKNDRTKEQYCGWFSQRQILKMHFNLYLKLVLNLIVQVVRHFFLSRFN